MHILSAGPSVLSYDDYKSRVRALIKIYIIAKEMPSREPSGTCKLFAGGGSLLISVKKKSILAKHNKGMADNTRCPASHASPPRRRVPLVSQQPTLGGELTQNEVTNYKSPRARAWLRTPSPKTALLLITMHSVRTIHGRRF